MLIWSCGRIIACANRRAAPASSLMSLRTLPDVSMASARFSGSSDCRSKTAISCGLPSSNTLKSLRVSPPTIAPLASVTLTKMFTSFTSTLNVVLCAKIGMGAARINAASIGAPIASIVRRLRFMLRLRWKSRDLLGKRLALRPHCAIRKHLFFPNRHRLLERVDEPSACIEGLRAMRGSNHDQYTGLADFEPAEPMNDHHLPHSESLARLRGQFSHLRQCHLLIRLVFEIERLAAARMIADDPVEYHNRSIFRFLGLSDQLLCFDAFTGQCNSRLA